MIRNLLATTAIATLLATGAVAQTTPPASDPSATMEQQTPMVIQAEGMLASDLIGESVYNSTSEDAENIGEITDLILSQDGQVEAIVVGVGGFLGIGQKEVALEYDLAQWAEQDGGERWLIVETTRDALEAQEEFDRTAYRPMPADAEVSETRPATADDLATGPAQQGEQPASDEMAADQQPADTETETDTAATRTDSNTESGSSVAVVPSTPSGAGADADSGEQAAATQDRPQVDDQQTAAQDSSERTDDQQAAATQSGSERPDDQQSAQMDSDQTSSGTDQTTTGAIDRSNLQEAQPDQISAEELAGTTVYGANEEEIGSVGDVILTPEGDIDAIIVDVGGFLGIGAKEVAIATDNLIFHTDEDGDLYLFTEFTQDELEAAPEYNEAAYAEQREEMRIQVQ
ncbi:PRC-barrel domain-containing protein [Chelativorans sp. Marseille-P2723]|uniref:PRC-barrel domain-containing protein n=1 Tax=Chelativorans sp. Marseille-P2723 TaxID=2709133 RepID=UPI00156D71F5|nr:PRC-barrel domain-containing protein [Chelativorans sp. Marseille-P2723]